MRRLAAVLVLLALTGRAEAHAFQSGADTYAQFTEGFGVALTDPRIVLLLIATGLALSLADPRGFPRQAPFLLAGLIGGVLIAPALPESAVLFTLALALIAGLCGALHLTKGLAVLTLLAGVAATTTGLSGHTFNEVPVMLKLGLVVGCMLVTSAAAAVVSMARERYHHPVTLILGRVIASWCAAIAVMLIAYVAKGLM